MKHNKKNRRKPIVRFDNKTNKYTIDGKVISFKQAVESWDNCNCEWSQLAFAKMSKYQLTGQ